MTDFNYGHCNLFTVTLFQNYFCLAPQVTVSSLMLTTPWDKPMLSVCWSMTNDEYNDTSLERGWVADAVRNSWEKYGGIKFDFVGLCSNFESQCQTSSDISIGLFEGNPRVEKFGSNLKGMSKGMLLNFHFLKWKKPCQLNRESCIRYIAIHEFGQALGIVHQQLKNDLVCNDTLCVSVELTKYDLDTTDDDSWNNDDIFSLKDKEILQKLYREIVSFMLEVFNECSTVF